VPKCDRRGGPLLTGEAQPVRDAVDRIIAVIEPGEPAPEATPVDAPVAELQQR